MGGGNSKEAQLDKLGQLFSAQEKKCLNTTFHIIAGYEEATFFSRDEFQVSALVDLAMVITLYEHLGLKIVLILT